MVSHGESRRDSCPARGVLDLAIGSSDWLGRELSTLFAIPDLNSSRCIAATQISPLTQWVGWVWFGLVWFGPCEDGLLLMMRLSRLRICRTRTFRYSPEAPFLDLAYAHREINACAFISALPRQIA